MCLYIWNLSFSFLLTLSRSERVAFKAPSGRPNGKQYLKNKKERILQVAPIYDILAWNILKFGSYTHSLWGAETAFYFVTLCYVNVNSHHTCVCIMYIYVYVRRMTKERLRRRLQQKRVFRVVTRLCFDFYCEGEPFVSSKETLNIITETSINEY